MRTGSVAIALLLLAGAWLGPLPDLARHSFAMHMTLHVGVVALAAPLFAFAAAGTRFDPVRVMPNALAPIPASMIELIVVWGWHLPILHDSARRESGVFVLEQGMFLAAGLLLWAAAVGGNPEQRRLRAGAGIAALLFTFMHMTLLGALFAMSSRPLFDHGPAGGAPSAIADQQLGGVIMLLVGGAAYLLGGLWLTAAALRPHMPLSLGRRDSTV